MRRLCLCLVLAVGCADDKPDDVCSDLDFDACAFDVGRCTWEAGTIQCLQLCRDGAGCPDGLTCAEGDIVDHCQGNQGCLAYAITDDVCRPGDE